MLKAFIGLCLERVAFEKLAVIILGDTEAIAGRADAEKFYRRIGNHMRSRGFNVQFDPGLPYTQPIAADVWIAHSRGVDRLRFAPPGTATIALSGPVDGAIWHPDDEQAGWPDAPARPSRYHFMLTHEMISAMDSV